MKRRGYVQQYFKIHLFEFSFDLEKNAAEKEIKHYKYGSFSLNDWGKGGGGGHSADGID
jgi:hypothetical protein